MNILLDNNLALPIILSAIVFLLFFYWQIQRLQQKMQLEWQQQRADNSEQQLKAVHLLQEHLQRHIYDMRNQLHETLKHNTEQLQLSFQHLTQLTQQQLEQINTKVEKRLEQGFEKTNAVFTDIIKRLALIDDAQKKMTELSSNVVSLQQILSDKSARGAFGEVQLSTLIRNVFPEQHFSLQHTLSNGKRVDCLLLLPPPSENIAIDAKFPLEHYQALFVAKDTNEKNSAMQLFRQSIRKHIRDIAEKYIIAGETSDGAIMFIPAESVFAEIYSYYPELVAEAQRLKVWLVSPTTMLAILTTARAALKDDATRRQAHIIREHLGLLAKDFSRFQKRMDQLAQHIDQAQTDVREVHISAEKITKRFVQIEKVEIADPAIAMATPIAAGNLIETEILEITE